MHLNDRFGRRWLRIRKFPQFKSSRNAVGDELNGFHKQNSTPIVAARTRVKAEDLWLSSTRRTSGHGSSVPEMGLRAACSARRASRRSYLAGYCQTQSPSVTFWRGTRSLVTAITPPSSVSFQPTEYSTKRPSSVRRYLGSSPLMTSRGNLSMNRGASAASVSGYWPLARRNRSSAQPISASSTTHWALAYLVSGLAGGIRNSLAMTKWFVNS